MSGGPQVTWTHPALPMILSMIPEDTDSLVDIGCGRGIVGALCRIYRRPTHLVGVDAYKPYLQFCERLGFYDTCVEWQLERLPIPFRDRQFDVATCIEVIEHLPRDRGEGLLDEIARIAKCVVLTTPACFFTQEQYDANPHQAHLSAWHPRDFVRRGYRVYGVGGMRIFGKRVKYLSGALGPFTRHLPTLSDSMLCVLSAPRQGG